jgi:glycosyltransferase involved in cell wall biosynthesis
MLGRISETKGCDLAVEALGLLRASSFRAELRLIGPSDPAFVTRLRLRAMDLGVEDRLYIGGFTSDPHAEILRSNVVLMCSRNEAFGRITAEALAGGRPVIGARSGGTTEIVHDGVDGLLFEPGNARELASAITILGQDFDRLLSMSRHARKLNHDRFSLDSQVDGFVAVLSDSIKVHH